MQPTPDIAPGQRIELPRSETVAEALAEVRTRARRFVQEPAEAAWDDLVHALRRAYGDGDTYDLLHAVEIHTRTSKSR